MRDFTRDARFGIWLPWPAALLALALVVGLTSIVTVNRVKLVVTW